MIGLCKESLSLSSLERLVLVEELDDKLSSILNSNALSRMNLALLYVLSTIWLNYSLFNLVELFSGIVWFYIFCRYCIQLSNPSLAVTGFSRSYSVVKNSLASSYVYGVCKWLFFLMWRRYFFRPHYNRTSVNMTVPSSNGGHILICRYILGLNFEELIIKSSNELNVPRYMSGVENNMMTRLSTIFYESSFYLCSLYVKTILFTQYVATQPIIENIEAIGVKTDKQIVKISIFT